VKERVEPRNSIGAAELARFARLRFVLVEPSHVGNIGASARAICTMGFVRLCLVRPRDPQFRSAPEALALAASATDVLAQASVYDTLEEALQGVHLAVATTGYAREFGPEPVELRAAARRGAQLVHEEAGELAFVFGPERTGLCNRDVQCCHASCAIPADPQRGSLNLAQAVQVVAYECRRELLAQAGQSAAAPVRRDQTVRAPRAAAPAASVDQIESMFAHLEQALIAVGYLDPDQPKHLMERLRHLLQRAQPSASEVDILRGVASAIILPRKLRAGTKRARRDPD